MKQFFKFMFASMLGVFLSFVLVIILFFIIVAGSIASMKKDKAFKVADNSVLELTLDDQIIERASNNPFDSFNPLSFDVDKKEGLNSILENITKAKKDEHVKGIYLHLSSVHTGIASLEEIRNALINFKESKKFVYAYGEAYSQGAYYLASVSDKIFLNPEGGIELKGLKAEMMFFKGALQKLEVEPEVIRHGKFKSAVEPFLLDKMSDANRKQTAAFVGSIWKHIVDQISKSRNIPQTRLQAIADSLLTDEPKKALNNKIIDAIAYEDEVADELRSKLGLGKDSKISFVKLNKYNHAPMPKDADKKGIIKDKIAVVYAVGAIESGKGDDNTIGSDRIAGAIRKARLDEHVKALVLRVNSPGGSALASDVIWREVILTKKVKPVVVSMGDVAASGGYYISCAANKIVAQPNTITGSIGVFGLLYNAQKLMNNKLGITIDTLKTAKHADLGTIFRGLSSSERIIIQNSVERIYTSFIGKVADGRSMEVADVDSIGQGRVWSGVDAKKIGLVDELGGIDVAIKSAKDLAKLDKYRITELPEQKEPFQKLLEDWSESARVKFFKQDLGEAYEYYNGLSKVLHMKGIQMRMPYDIRLN